MQIIILLWWRVHMDAVTVANETVMPRWMIRPIQVKQVTQITALCTSHQRQSGYFSLLFPLGLKMVISCPNASVHFNYLSAMEI